MTTRWVLATTALLALATAGCTGSESEKHKERMDYLRATADRGVEAHRLMASSEANITKDRCERNFAGLHSPNQRPPKPEGGTWKEWESTIKDFYVDSCVSGKPKQVPGDEAQPEPSESLSPSTSPATSASPG